MVKNVNKTEKEDSNENSLKDVDFDVNDWKQRISKYKGSDANYHIVWHGRNKNVPIIKNIKMNPETGKEFLNSLTEQINNIDASKIVNYMDDDSSDHEGYAMENTNKIPKYNMIVDSLPKVNEEWNRKDETNTNKHGLSFILSVGDFYAFGSISKRNNILTKPGKIAMKFTSNIKFEKVDRDEIVYELPNIFSAISLDDTILIKSESSLERIFQYNEKVTSMIESNTQANQRLFSDPDKYVDSVKKDPIKARKLFHVYSDKKIDAYDVNAIRLYKNQNKNVHITIDPKSGKIDYSKSNSWDVIHLLSEDYYKGQLTQTSYLSRQKSVSR